MPVSYTRRNLCHEKNKLALSVFGVASALVLILILMGFRAGLYATLTAYVDNIGADLIVAQDGVQGMFSSNSALPLAIHEQSVKAAGAIEAGHILLADIIFTSNNTKTPVLLVGFQPETTFGSPWKFAEGYTVQADNEIAMDSWLAKRAGLKLGDTVAVLGQDFTIVGLTSETASWMSPYIFITLNAAEQAFGLSGIVSYHLLKLPEGSDLEVAATAIEEAIPGVNAMTPNEIVRSDRRVLANIMDIPINVMLIIGIVIGIAVMGLTSYTAISNRIREYGVLKAIGANGWHLVWFVIQETLVRAVFGYLLGTGLAYLAAALIMARWPQFNILILPETIWQIAILALFMNLVAALLPLRRLQQIDPILVFKG